MYGKDITQFRCHHSCLRFRRSKQERYFIVKIKLNKEKNVMLSSYLCCSYFEDDKQCLDLVPFILKNPLYKMNI